MKKKCKFCNQQIKSMLLLSIRLFRLSTFKSCLKKKKRMKTTNGSTATTKNDGII